MDPEYTSDFHSLKSVFNPVMKEINIPGSGIRIVNLNFSSDFSIEGFSDRNDVLINENMEFSYPIFVPPGNKISGAILFLHGLNERSWTKYLPWAYWLSQLTGNYVILFPISFHINRSPGSWIDPRKMVQNIVQRKNSFGDIQMSSFANIALSERLTSEPMRFFSSGYQTANDIIKLMRQIREGRHELIPGGVSINLFAYSIGAFLAQIMMLGNPQNLFADSRLFMFCGGSVFSNMHGTSKLIMDNLAYNRVYNFFLKDFEAEIGKESHLSYFLRSSQLGIAFRSMLDFSKFRAFRDNFFWKLKGQIRSIALFKDSVIPPEGIVKTLNTIIRNNKNSVDVWDFPYAYSHENPFPVFNNTMHHDVDNSFRRLITEAAQFL